MALNSLKGVSKDGSGNQKGKVVGKDFYVEVRFLPASHRRAPWHQNAPLTMTRMGPSPVIISTWWHPINVGMKCEKQNSL